jgi:hypothetical protein
LKSNPELSTINTQPTLFPDVESGSCVAIHSISIILDLRCWWSFKLF